jgi:hypothetical protein
MIDASLEEAKQPYNFQEYDNCLKIILLILKNWCTGKYNSQLLISISSKFEELAPSIGKEYRKSWAADATLKQEYSNLNENVKAELRNIIDQHNYFFLKFLIKKL